MSLEETTGSCPKQLLLADAVIDPAGFVLRATWNNHLRSGTLTVKPIHFRA